MEHWRIKFIWRFCLLTLCVSFMPHGVFGQEVTEEETELVEQTFFGTRMANNQSSETLERGYLDMRLGHRMGRISSGVEDLFGFNQATSQFALEYGITNDLMAGVKNNTIDKIYEGFVKYKILKQSTGAREVPFTMTYCAGMEIQTGTLNYPNDQYYFSSRLFYTHQLIMARKFTDKVSLQISPVFVHKNMVKTREDKNNILLLSFAGRYKVKRKIALMAEYNMILPGQIFSDVNGNIPVNSLAVGVDIYTGRHTFQLFITNAVAMNGKTYLTETTEHFFGNGIHVGFNISRLFNIVDYYE